MKHIYINESLTERTKTDLKFLYSAGKIYLRKTQDSPVILVNNKDDLKKRVLMGVPNYQLTANFSANCQLTTIFLANCQLTVNPISTLFSSQKNWRAIFQ